MESKCICNWSEDSGFAPCRECPVNGEKAKGDEDD